ncbi:MAG: LysR family transcriptional regulator [Bdellovibrionales bacterium]|nr:LysR family transcriptional regulator [Bdellovibrionales bacterium]
MTLDQLKILIAVSDEGSLGAASRVLNRTQPTLSVGLKNLEDELGVLLFDRSGYRMKLTPAGEQILLSAKRTLAEADEIEKQAAGYKSGRESEISIGLDYLCPLPVLLSVLRRFSDNCKGTRLNLKFGVLGETEAWLRSGEIDIAVTPFLQNRTDYEMTFLCDLKIVPVLANQLVQKESFTEAEFLQVPQIVVTAKPREGDDAPFAGLAASPKWWVSDHMIKRQLVVSGFGWGHLEASSIVEELKTRQVVELENKYVRNSRLPLHLARRQNVAAGVVARELWSYMQQEFEYVE